MFKLCFVNKMKGNREKSPPPLRNEQPPMKDLLLVMVILVICFNDFCVCVLYCRLRLLPIKRVVPMPNPLGFHSHRLPPRKLPPVPLHSNFTRNPWIRHLHAHRSKLLSYLNTTSLFPNYCFIRQVKYDMPSPCPLILHTVGKAEVN